MRKKEWMMKKWEWMNDDNEWNEYVDNGDRW